MAKKKWTKAKREAFDRCVETFKSFVHEDEVAALAAEMLFSLTCAEREQPRAMSTVISCSEVAIKRQRKG